MTFSQMPVNPVINWVMSMCSAGITSFVKSQLHRRWFAFLRGFGKKMMADYL